MKFTEILKQNRELGAQLDGRKYNIAAISNITINQLKDVLEYTLRIEGIPANVEIGDYDSIVQDSMRFSDADAVIVVWEACNLIDGLNDKIFLMSEGEIDSLVEKIENEMSLLLTNLKSVPLVLVNKFSAALFENNPLVREPLSRLSMRLNEILENSVSKNCLIINTDSVLMEVGRRQALDLRMYQSSKALYSLDFIRQYCSAIKPVFKAITGRVKKVLVLDCDNTLWHGILGEDGEDGIQLNNNTLAGKAFKEVQTIVKGIQKEGVLIVLCSKNNSYDVERVLSNHADMLIRDSDIVAKMINWDDKATNMRALAKDLNLGLDSFVFVDDSAFEIGLIQKELPMVMCIKVPDNLSEYPSVIRQLRQEFFTLSKSAEDSRKTEMYKQAQLRSHQPVKFSSTEDYLASLELKTSILWNEEVPVARASQMTQKTNQFNLTTKRLTEAEIAATIQDSCSLTAAFSVGDKYGDYGISGLIIIKRHHKDSKTALLDTFLMSCRVIGRNVEYAIFDKIIHRVKESGFRELHAKYIATAKNKQVENFYDILGFTLCGEQPEVKEYKLTLNNYEFQNIPYINSK